MGDIKNLNNREAVKKLQELTKGENCMLCTFESEFNFTSRPMGTIAVEDDGSIWFFSHRSSNKNSQIAINNKVQLIYSNPGKLNYLSLSGDATIIKDQDKIDELWSPILKTWFPEGKDDPEITLLKVTPAEAHYWDTKHGKMVAFMKILLSSVTGQTADDGVQGELVVS